MTVQEIFALRKQGKIEEAYEAIRPIYKEHKGRFTTLCMFWTATDVFKLRLEQGRVEEAEKIYKAMLRMLPSVEAYEQADEHEQAQPESKKHSAANFMHYAEGRLIKASEKFRRRYFAMRDKSKRGKTPPLAPPLVGAGSNEGINIPPDNPSKGINSCDSSNSCSEKANICDIRAICVTEKPAAGDISALSAGQEKVLDCIKAHPGLKVPGIEAETGIPAKSIERHIKVLIERNLIEHRGSKKTGGYHAL